MWRNRVQLKPTVENWDGRRFPSEIPDDEDVSTESPIQPSVEPSVENEGVRTEQRVVPLKVGTPLRNEARAEQDDVQPTMRRSHRNKKQTMFYQAGSST